MRHTLTIARLRAMQDAGRITPRETVMLYWDAQDNRFQPPLYERALQRADYAAERIAEDSTRDTTGVPVAVDAAMLIEGCAPDNGKASAYSGTLIRKLDGYGALIIGLLRGSPWFGAYAAHAAMAVTGHHCLASLSLNVLPGSPDEAHLMAGVSALKPSFGTVSRYGVAMGAPSLKQVGIAAGSARDAAVLMDAISDFDPYDPAMLRPNCYHYAEEIGKAVEGLRIGVCEGADTGPLESLGCACTPFALPGGIRETHAAVEAAEFAFTLAKSAPGDPAWEKAASGLRVLESGQYEQALGTRGAIARAFAEALHSRDAIAMPLTRGEPGLAAMAAELCGLPCAARGNTVLIGRMCDEVTLLRLAAALEGEDAC